jgi:hypothetical protein
MGAEGRGRHLDPTRLSISSQQQDAELEHLIRQLETGEAGYLGYITVDAALDRLRENYVTGRMHNVGQLITYIHVVAHQLYVKRCSTIGPY